MDVRNNITGAELEQRFRDIYEQRMQGLPFVNTRLEVEAIGFRSFHEFEIGVLITPWFMNLILLPEAGAGTAIDQGHKINAQFASGDIEFTAARDEELGLFFSAVLFSSVSAIPDQEKARDLADEVMARLFKREQKTFRRRALFLGSEQADA